MRHTGALAAGGVALAALAAGGEHGAAAAAEAVEITVAVVIVLAVIGLALAVIMRARAGERRRYRPDPAIGPLRVRAEVIGRTPGRSDVRPLALAAADPREDWPADFPVLSAGREDGVKSQDNRRTR